MVSRFKFLLSLLTLALSTKLSFALELNDKNNFTTKAGVVKYIWIAEEGDYASLNISGDGFDYSMAVQDPYLGPQFKSQLDFYRLAYLLASRGLVKSMDYNYGLGLISIMLKDNSVLKPKSFHSEDIFLPTSSANGDACVRISLVENTIRHFRTEYLSVLSNKNGYICESEMPVALLLPN